MEKERKWFMLNKKQEEAYQSRRSSVKDLKLIKLSLAEIFNKKINSLKIKWNFWIAEHIKKDFIG